MRHSMRFNELLLFGEKSTQHFCKTFLYIRRGGQGAAALAPSPAMRIPENVLDLLHAVMYSCAHESLFPNSVDIFRINNEIPNIDFFRLSFRQFTRAGGPSVCVRMCVLLISFPFFYPGTTSIFITHGPHSNALRFNK